MTNKYYVGRDGEDGAYVSMHESPNPLEGYLDSFIDIWVDDGKTMDSPFKNIDDAELFAKIIVKLLNKLGEDCDIE